MSQEPLPCFVSSGECAMVIAAADSSATHDYPPSVPALVASPIAPSSSPLHLSKPSSWWSSQTILTCPAFSSDAPPLASSLLDPFDIGRVPIPSRHRPCPKISALACAVWQAPCTFFRRYSVPCCTAKRSTSATNGEDGSSSPDHNSLPTHSPCQSNELYCNSPVSVLGMGLPSLFSPATHRHPFSLKKHATLSAEITSSLAG